MAKFFAIVREEKGSLEDGHLCYVGNDSDMDSWKVEPGYKLVELTPEEHTSLSLLDIVVERDGKEVVVEAKEIRSDDNAKGVKKYEIDVGKVTKYVKDRLKVDVPIEIDGIGGKEIIGYELKPETIITEKAEKIKAK